MEGRLLIIKKQWEPYEDLLRGFWQLEPENDPNSLGTPLTHDQIPKNPRSLLEPMADTNHRAAESRVLVFLTRILEEDRFQATEEWTAWALHSLDCKEHCEPGREIFEAVIVRGKWNKQ